MEESPRLRMSVIGLICMALFATLLTRLWYLQGISQETFEAASRQQRTRVIHEQAPRGRIRDRNGVILVDNEITTVIGAVRKDIEVLPVEDREVLYQRLADKLTKFDGIERKAADIKETINDGRYGPLQFIPLVDNAPEEIELFFAEHAESFPGISVRRKTVRTYPYGWTASNIVGYVGPINDREYTAKTAEEKAALAAGRDDYKHYEPDDEIGKLGIEASMEQYLRGTPGKRIVEVSRTGEIVKEISRIDPRTGSDVYLTIDIRAQAWAEWVLQEHQRDVRGKYDKEQRPYRAPEAAAVVMSPQTGEIIVAASSPLFNPAPLVHGISSKVWAELNDPDKNYPLNNYALQGEYAPGSTFKLFTALAALRNGLFDPPNPQGFDDTSGKYTLDGCEDTKCTFRNAGNAVGGYVELPRSITVSNDVFYYWLGERFWRGREVYGETAIQKVARDFGFGSETGVQMSERAGIIPTPDRRRAQHKENPTAFPNGGWYTGDNLNLAIGQGEVLVTPLQLTNGYGTFANGGTHFQPQLVQRIATPDPTKPAGPDNLGAEVTTFKPVVQNRVKIDAEDYQKVLSGLEGVVNSSSGTAYDAFNDSPLPGTWAGKTGTAESGSKARPKADTSVFALFGPIEAGTPVPYVATAFFPESGFGSDVAAPTVLRILRPIITNEYPELLSAQQLAAGARPPSLPPLSISDRKAD